MRSVIRSTRKKQSFCCVGILTIPHSKKVKQGTSHIMKAYVDWLEERGVRVLPIPYDTKEHEVYFYQINGLLIPGGETVYILKNEAFVHSVTRFVELSFQKGEYFPIWGTCFGFQSLLHVIGDIPSFQKHPNHGVTPLHITKEGRHSRMFASFTKRYLHYLEAYPSTSNNNEYGISPREFEDNPHLRRFFRVVTTSIDENGQEYVSTIEGAYYPVYGVQWHPERQNTTGQFVDFFVSELKKNKHVCKGIPFVRGTVQAHRCVQYPEHKNLHCYFFS